MEDELSQNAGQTSEIAQVTDIHELQAAREKLENGEADRQTEEMLSQVLTGEWEPVSHPSQEENKPIPDKRNAVNFHISNDDLGVGTPKEKFRRNVEAIKLLGQIEGEHRYATPQEQEILSQYVGWGGLADAFDEGKQNWTAEYQELKKLLSPEEYRMARESTLNAHYTSPAIIRSMYEAIERMGFTKGNILEPSMGIGNFFYSLMHECEEGYDYSILDEQYHLLDGGVYDNPDITIQRAMDMVIADLKEPRFSAVTEQYYRDEFLQGEVYAGSETEIVNFEKLSEKAEEVEQADLEAKQAEFRENNPDVVADFRAKTEELFHSLDGQSADDI